MNTTDIKYVYTYLWCRQGHKPIELTGAFTEERFKTFCKYPYPVEQNVTITIISREILK